MDSSAQPEKSKHSTPEINPAVFEQIMRSNPAAAAFGVAVSEVWIWIHGALVSKRGQRRRVLEVFLDAPNHRLTSTQLVLIAHQYGARVKELRDAGFPIPNLPTQDGGTFFELMITEQQEREIRVALAVADAIKQPRTKKVKKPVTAAAVQPPPTDSLGQFGFGFEPVIGVNGFLDMERGVRK